ncbi:MAG: Mg2 transporter protein CorA family protein [Parcubacteria group bacterium GW2011_GWA2_39_18]|nr:MAG: Mg2 transporter protein CorA family protein [Parcubacteria group bacterium GW2011_GWA2_39_18]
MQKIQTKNITWIDIQNPTDSDIELLKKEHGVHGIVLEQLRQPSIRPAVEQYPHYLYLIMHFPIFNAEKRTSQSTEVDFIIFKDIVITVHYNEVGPLKDTFNKCNHDEDYRLMCVGENSGQLIYHIIHDLLVFSLRELDHIRKNIENIENAIFSGQEEEMVREISIVHRDVLNFYRTVRPERGTLESLEARSDAWFDKKEKPFFTDLVGDYMKVWNLLESYKDTLESLQNTNNSLISDRTNKIVKTLTILSVALMPPALMISIFSNNFIFYRSYWNIPLEALVIIILTPLSVFVSFAIFRYKKWL